MVNVLVHLREPLSFWLRCRSLLLSKLYFIIKVSTICGASRDTRNLCHEFNSQGHALCILGFRVTCPKSQGPSSRVLAVRVPCPRIPVSESWVSGHRVPGTQSPRIAGSRVPESRFLGSRVSGLGSQVLI